MRTIIEVLPYLLGGVLITWWLAWIFHAVMKLWRQARWENQRMKRERDRAIMQARYNAEMRSRMRPMATLHRCDDATGMQDRK